MIRGTKIGQSLLPLLRRIRGEGPGRQRARALTVLAVLGGETALSAKDAATVERLIRMKLATDLVLGAWCDPCGEARSEDLLHLCTRLSSRYGRAQAYYYGAQGDGSAWLAAEDGRVVRRYCETGDGEDELLTLGDPLPYERIRREELGLLPEWDPALESEADADAWKWAAFDLAPDIARSLGVSPLSIGPETPSRGTGVIALTPYGVAHGVPTGAYRI